MQDLGFLKMPYKEWYNRVKECWEKEEHSDELAKELGFSSLEFMTLVEREKFKIPERYLEVPPNADLTSVVCKEPKKIKSLKEIDISDLFKKIVKESNDKVAFRYSYLWKDRVLATDGYVLFNLTSPYGKQKEPVYVSPKGKFIKEKDLGRYPDWKDVVDYNKKYSKKEFVCDIDDVISIVNGVVLAHKKLGIKPNKWYNYAITIGIPYKDYILKFEPFQFMNMLEILAKVGFKDLLIVLNTDIDEMNSDNPYSMTLSSIFVYNKDNKKDYSILMGLETGHSRVKDAPYVLLFD